MICSALTSSATVFVYNPHALCHVGHHCLSLHDLCTRVCACPHTRARFAPAAFISRSLMCQWLLQIHSSRRCLRCSAAPLRTHQAISWRLAGIKYPFGLTLNNFQVTGALHKAAQDRNLTDGRPPTSHVLVKFFSVARRRNLTDRRRVTFIGLLDKLARRKAN